MWGGEVMTQVVGRSHREQNRSLARLYTSLPSLHGGDATAGQAKHAIEAQGQALASGLGIVTGESVVSMFLQGGVA